jgi:DNA uptake protein ComE-like DNA-binding protein
MRPARPSSFDPLRRQRGSVLIIVLWICLGLVVLVLYFADATNSELEAAANRVGEVEARQAVAAGTRYAASILNNYAIDGVVPDNGIPPDPAADYYSEALQVGDDPGDPQFWFIGRDVNNAPTTDPVFCLVDEASRLNLNTATAAMLGALPMANMTSDFASATVSWRTRQSQSSGSALNNTYSALDPPRLNKGASFESVDELRLVYGATLDLLFGEDTNLNGALDLNEDDGDQSPPRDNQDGQLQPGMLEYVTTFSAQPNTTRSGSPRLNIANIRTSPQSLGQLRALLTRSGISAGRAAAILRSVSRGAGAFTSVADFMLASGMTANEFALVHTSITATAGSSLPGLVNVNTASETVLACIPGIGPANAPSLVAYRTANPTALTSLAWIARVLSPGAIRRAGPYITDQSYQFSADIAAVGRFGRGYHREKVVFDTSMGTPRIIYRQDLSAYGWALGRKIRKDLKTARR